MSRITPTPTQPLMPLTRTESTDLFPLVHPVEPSTTTTNPYMFRNVEDGTQPPVKRPRRSRNPEQNACVEQLQPQPQQKQEENTPPPQQVNPLLCSQNSEMKLETEEAKGRRMEPTCEVESLRVLVRDKTFIPVSSGKLQDVYWMIIGAGEGDTQYLDDELMDENARYVRACNRAAMGSGEVEMTKGGWVSLVVTYFLPISYLGWCTLCTTNIREHWKNVELYCYLIYCQLWASHKKHARALESVGDKSFPEAPVLLDYNSWIHAIEDKARKEGFAICVESETTKGLNKRLRQRVWYLLNSYTQLPHETPTDPLVLFQKKTQPIYTDTDSSGVNLLTQLEQSITPCSFFSASQRRIDAPTMSRAIVYRATLFPTKLTPTE